VALLINWALVMIAAEHGDTCAKRSSYYCCYCCYYYVIGVSTGIIKDSVDFTGCVLVSVEMDLKHYKCVSKLFTSSPTFLSLSLKPTTLALTLSWKPWLCCVIYDFLQ